MKEKLLQADEIWVAQAKHPWRMDIDVEAECLAGKQLPHCPLCFVYMQIYKHI